LSLNNFPHHGLSALQMVAEQGLLVSAQSSASCWAWGQLTWAIAYGAGNGPPEPRPGSPHGHRDRPKAVRPGPPQGLREAGASRGTLRSRRHVSTQLTSGTWSQSVENPFAGAGVERTIRGSRRPESRPRRRPCCRRHTHGRSAVPMGAAAKAAIYSWRVTRRLVRRRASHCLRAGVLRLRRSIPNPSTRNPCR
jgi:hypothetical protein